MRTGIVEETTEANRVAAESARPGPVRTQSRVQPRRREALPPESRFTASLVLLGRLFDHADPKTTPPADRLVRAAALFVEATGAERVAIYRTTAPASSPPIALELAAHATAPGLQRTIGTVEPSARLELDALQVSARRLLAGQAARVVRPLALSLPRTATRLAPASGWARVGSTLQIPCAGSEGLNAIVCFEGERFDPARAEAAVAVFAAGLERERLEGALASMRAERARSERLALLGRAAGGAAHDLNNVLTAILGHADLLELELGLERSAVGGQADLEEIREAVARGAGLVEELLAFGRPRAASSDEVDLAEVLGRLAGMARRVAGEAIELDLRLEPGLGPVRIDREAFERAVLNLVANARHAIEARPRAAGRIAVVLEPVRADRAGAGDAGDATGAADGHGRWVRLSIADDGCGMPADVASRIFEPFFTTRATSGGTGLGLAGVAECVRRGGGRIAVESAPGSGTTFRIDLPRAPVRPRA